MNRRTLIGATLAAAISSIYKDTEVQAATLPVKAPVCYKLSWVKVS